MAMILRQSTPLTAQLTQSIRENPRPILLECVTFRMRGHEEASGTKYYPEGLIDSWKAKDPIDQFRARILADRLDDGSRGSLLGRGLP